MRSAVMQDEELRAEEHVEETVAQLRRMYEEHARQTSRIQLIANRLTAALGRPVALLLIVGSVLVWVLGNYLAHMLGSVALERFPFPDLAFIATIAALLVALLILTTQRHQDDLAERRARLTLQIAALSEKKIAKVIELLEQQRRDNPLLPDRDDAAARSMAKPVDAIGDLQAGRSDDGGPARTG